MIKKVKINMSVTDVLGMPKAFLATVLDVPEHAAIAALSPVRREPIENCFAVVSHR